MKITNQMYNGILSSADENRYRYFIARSGDSYEIIISQATDELKRINEISSELYVAWIGKAFAKGFISNTDSLVKEETVQYNPYDFYRKALTEMIHENVQLLIMPNYAGQGIIATAKEIKVAIFKEVWEGDQDEWIFKLK